MCNKLIFSNPRIKIKNINEIYSFNLVKKLQNQYKNYDFYIKSRSDLNFETGDITPYMFTTLEKNTLYLGRTIEYTKTDYYVPMLEGRSSIGRLGLFIHVTAGFGDVGFAGFWTLEMFCIQPIRIYRGVEICQIFYHTIEGDYDRYASVKYQNNTGVQPSLLYKDFEKNNDLLLK